MPMESANGPILKRQGRAKGAEKKVMGVGSGAVEAQGPARKKQDPYVFRAMIEDFGKADCAALRKKGANPPFRTDAPAEPKNFDKAKVRMSRSLPSSNTERAVL